MKNFFRFKERIALNTLEEKTNINKEKTEAEIVKKRVKNLWADKRSYKKRLIIAGASLLAACFMVIFFGPIELVAFSGGSLLYTYTDVIWLLFLGFVVIWAGLSLLISLLRGMIFNYVVSSVFAFTVAGYLQAMFLNGSLGTLTGDAINWHTMKSDLLIGIFVWLFITLACFLLMYLHKRIWANTIKYVSLILVLIQIIPLVGIVAGAYDIKSSEVGTSKLTTEGMYDYSQNKNTFVFVLDRLDFDYVEAVMAEEPEFFDKLTGFTGFTNAISSTARTEPALNQLLTGCEDLAYRVPKNDFFRDSWFEGGKDILRDISAKDYSIDIYTEANVLFADGAYMEKYVQNASSGYSGLNYPTAFKKMMYLSAFRYVPIFLKPFFWADTTYYNRDVLNYDNTAPYAFDDVKFMSDLKNGSSTVEKNSFKFYHFNGPHAPYEMDKDGNRSAEATNARDQLMGCMTHLYNAFDKMKELGIYDDATIIITADHGAAMYDDKPLVKATRNGLFYKPSGSSDEAIKWSGAPVCTDNIPATILKSVGADYSLYGRSLDEVGEDEDIVRYYYKSSTEWSSTFSETKIYKYEVKGDASKFENWVLVEEIETENSFY